MNQALIILICHTFSKGCAMSSRPFFSSSFNFAHSSPFPPHSELTRRVQRGAANVQLEHAISDELITCYQYINVSRSEFPRQSRDEGGGAQGCYHSSREHLIVCLGPVDDRTAKALSRWLVQPGNGDWWSLTHCWA